MDTAVLNQSSESHCVCWATNLSHGFVMREFLQVTYTCRIEYHVGRFELGISTDWNLAVNDVIYANTVCDCERLSVESHTCSACGNHMGRWHGRRYYKLAVSVDGVTHPLPRPFLVMATQNPIELEGTFPLPEAQVDRFLLKLPVGYPAEEEEHTILLRFEQADPLDTLEAVTTAEENLDLQRQVCEVRVEASVRSYIVDVVRATRAHKDIQLGASPRGSLALYKCAQALAAIRGRDYVLPDDIKLLAPYVLTHRIIISPATRLRGRQVADVLMDVIGTVPVPVERL